MTVGPGIKSKPTAARVEVPAEESFGAFVTREGIDFKVWAPSTAQVDVIVHGETPLQIPMRAMGNGVFCAQIAKLKASIEYQFQIDGQRYPDPYSRFQPHGPHGPSMAVDTRAYGWRDRDWRGISLQGQIIYELHVGTFTKEGTFDAAAEKLRWLREMGITAVEVMPIAEFPGRFNWGYDGVNLFAPFHGYGDYEAFKRFVDAAHREKIGVILDVVYNHLGPDGNYLGMFSPNYFNKEHHNDWGLPFNVDGEDSEFVRLYLLDNARYWVREFHLDGLRLDASGHIPDKSKPHILMELEEQIRAVASPRSIVLIAEDEQQPGSRLLPQDRGGFGLDAMWNDDFHHSAQVALRGRRHAYLNDHRGVAQEFVSGAKYGFLFQGQFYFWQKQPRGQRMRASAMACVNFIDNHDQIANSLYGLRSHHGTSAAKYRALTALLLLGPQTPMIFMGQEFGAATRFLYFADHQDPLRAAVINGRNEFLAQFDGIATADAVSILADPADPRTFERSKLSWGEDARDAAIVALHRDLIRLRREDPVIRLQDAKALDGAVLSEHAFVLRWFNDEYGDRLLVVNFGADLTYEPGPEPLIAPSLDRFWSIEWSSARIAYGGGGVESPESEDGWRIPGETAILLRERPISDALTLDA